MFCEKEQHQQKSPHFFIKNENLHTGSSNSLKSNRKARKGEDIMTSLPEGFSPIYTLVTHLELLTTNQAFNITL